MPSDTEMAEGRENLRKHDNSVDFIISHCAASSAVALLSQGMFKPDALTDCFEEIWQSVKYKKWFFGHYYDNRNINAEGVLLWEQIIRIA